MDLGRFSGPFVSTFLTGGMLDTIVDTSVNPFTPPNNDFGLGLGGESSCHLGVSGSDSVGLEKKAKLLRLAPFELLLGAGIDIIAG